MKKTIFILAVILMLVLTGCTLNEAEEKEVVNDEEEAMDLVVEYNDQFDKTIIIIMPVFEYESDLSSKSLLNNFLSKISKFNKEVKELEKTLEEVNKLEFENKEEFVSINKEFLDIAKKITAGYSEMLHYELDFMKQSVLEQKENKIEDLMDAVYNCRCAEVDCDSYKESSLEFMESSIEIFRKIRTKYGLRSFDKIIGSWTKEKEISEKHWPELIRQSKRYGDRCYKINEEYNEYLNELDQVDYITEEEIADDISEKWVIPITDLVTEWDQSALKLNKIKVKMGFELI